MRRPASIHIVLALGYFVSWATAFVNAEPPGPRPLMHTGACDGSAGVAINEYEFLSVSDEEDRLRLFRVDRPGPARIILDLTSFLRIPGDDDTESDLEGAAQVGSRVYWIGSYSRSRKGKAKPRRAQLIATDLVGSGPSLRIVPAGRPYRHLLRDLQAQPAFQKLIPASAYETAPEQPGGFNIEGLAAGPDGTLWVGLRNPVPHGRALLFSITNPEDLIEGRQRAQLGPPILLDLGGAGVRSLEWQPSRRRFLIVSGHFTDVGSFSLWAWAPETPSATRLVERLPAMLNPEGLFISPTDPDRATLLSDDGGQDLSGHPCKEVTTLEERRFRSLSIHVPAGGR